MIDYPVAFKSVSFLGLTTSCFCFASTECVVQAQVKLTFESLSHQLGIQVEIQQYAFINKHCGSVYLI